MTEPVACLLWASLGLAAYALLVQPAFVLAYAALRGLRDRTTPQPRTPLVVIVTMGRLRDRHLAERIASLVHAAETRGRCECLVGVPRDELGYVRERLGRIRGVRLVPTETTDFDAGLLADVATEVTCDAVLVVPPGVALHEDAIDLVASELRDGVGLVQGLVERSENSAWLPVRTAAAEATLGGLHRIGDGPFLVRAETLAAACREVDRAQRVDAGLLAAALAESGKRMAVAPVVAAPTSRSAIGFLEFDHEGKRYFGWGADVRARATRAGGLVGRWLRFHERLRGWTPALFVVAIAANMALATDPFYLRVLAIQECAHVVWLSTRRRVLVRRSSTLEAREHRTTPEDSRVTPATSTSKHLEPFRTDQGADALASGIVREPRRGTRAVTVLRDYR